MPPRTRPVRARLSVSGQLSRCKRACRTETMMSNEKAVKGDMTGAVGV